MSPSDITAALTLASRFENNPKRLVHRAMGMTRAEADQGIPLWAWSTLLLFVGALGGAYLARRYPEYQPFK